jgi:hypothetical protein
MSNIDPISSDLGVVVKTLLAARGNLSVASSIAEARKSSPRIPRILKAAVGAGSMSDASYGEVLGDWRISSNAFFGSLRNRSIFFRLLDSGFARVPLRIPLGVVVAGATAWSRGEGKPIPVSKLTLDTPTLEPTTAAALIVVTDEVARSMEESSYSLVNTELRGAVSDVVDQAFFATVMLGVTPLTAGDGPVEEGHVLQMLQSVNSSGAGTLLWAMSPDVANGFSLQGDPFKGMTPLGGELLGLPAMVSAAIPAGTLRLINAASVAANADGIELDVSNQASIQLDDAPTNESAAPTASELVSLFQTNSVAMRVVVSFGVDKIRGNAVAELADIDWTPTP